MILQTALLDIPLDSMSNRLNNLILVQSPFIFLNNLQNPKFSFSFTFILPRSKASTKKNSEEFGNLPRKGSWRGNQNHSHAELLELVYKFYCSDGNEWML